MNVLGFIGNDSAWVWAAIQAVSVSVTLGLIYLQIRQQSRSNIVQTLNLLSEKWNRRGLLVARARVCRCWINKEDKDEGEFEFSGDACEIANYFEELGSYVKAGLVDKSICWDIFSYQIEAYFTLFENGIKLHRRELKDMTAFERFEWLRSQMLEMSQAKRVLSNMNSAQYKQFMDCEFKSAEAVLKDYEFHTK